MTNRETINQTIYTLFRGKAVGKLENMTVGRIEEINACRVGIVIIGDTVHHTFGRIKSAEWYLILEEGE